MRSHRNLMVGIVAVLGALMLALTVGGPALQAAAGLHPVEQNAATPAQVVPGSASNANAGDWDRIKASGVLTVGTAAASPPFAFYTGALQVDGFDVALLQALAEKLGLKLALIDYAFDGLPTALQQGQVEAIAAALTMTDERAAMVDFSMPYFSSAEGILAPANSPLNQIDLAKQDFAALRLGVQTGTVYETWARQQLIDSGRMPAANLQTFGREDDMVQALKDGRIDLAMTDLLPAKYYVQQGGVKLVGQGQIRQQYAIAVRKGSSLLPQLNFALTQLQQDGTLDSLVKKYLGQQEAPPTPTPPAPVACVSNLAYVADVTFDDNVTVPFVQPGQPFTKIWRVQNNGACPWTKDFALAFTPMNGSAVAPNQLIGVPVPLKESVQPGATADVAVNLVAPMAAGPYQGVWHMVDAKGQAFGQALTARVQVPNFAPTPAPTATPVQGINFTVDKTAIRAGAGECVNFKWNVTGVRAVFFYRQGQDFRQHGVSGQSGQRECPQATTTYFLRVDKTDGASVTPSITIYVTVDPDAPYVRYFMADPDKLNTKQCTTLSWQVTGQVTDLAIKRNGSSWWDRGAPLQGSQQDCLKNAGAYVYEITAFGPGGTSRQAATVTVYDKPAPAPTPTPFTPAPVPAVLEYFTVSPDQISMGGCVDVAWGVGGGVTRTELRINDTPLGRYLNAHDSQHLCPSSDPNTRLKFTLVADGMAGTPPIREDRFVQVLGPAPAPTATPVPTDLPPTPVPEPPAIGRFDASTGQINVGECFDLSWSVGGAAEVAQLYLNGSYLTDVGFNDSRHECPGDPGTYSYRLRAAGNGQEVTRDVAVQVQTMPAPPPTEEPPTPEPPAPEPPVPAPEPDNGGNSGG